MAASQELRTMMVDKQVRPSDVTKFPIISAMLEVEREAFVPPARQSVAYMDAPVPLGGDREMMEARTFARMLDALDIDPEDQVLIVGGGLGYSTAVVARMADSVVMVEEDAALASEAETTLAGQEVLNAAVLNAPLTEGAAKAAPFDVILIDGGVETVPDTILGQLKPGGRIAAIFLDGRLGRAQIGHSIPEGDGGAINWRFAFNAASRVLPGFETTREFTF